MKLYLIAFATSLTAIFPGRAEDEDEDLAGEIAVYADAISSAVDGERWEVSSTSSCILVKSKFEIGVYATVNPSLGAKPRKTNYRFELQFKPELSKAEYRELANERIDAAALLNYGTTDVAEWQEASRFLKENPLPRFITTGRTGKSYHVYLTNPFARTAGFTPNSLYAEIKLAEIIAGSCFFSLAE